MDTSSDSDGTPIPRKRTVKDSRKGPPSPESPSTSSPTKRRHHHQPERVKAEVEVESSERRKPRLPKPKPRKFSSPPSTSNAAAAISSAPKARTHNPEEMPPPSASPSVPKAKKRPTRKTTTAAAGAERISEPEVSTGRGDEGGGLRIQDILHAFQDDVVTLKSSNRNKWQEKLDEIQSKILFPELEHRKFETVSGSGDGGSVPSKWKSAASLIPRDSKPGEGRAGNNGRSNEDFSILKLFRIIHNLGNFSSGIVSGLLLWKGLFAVSQMISGQGFTLSPFFWILFWTVTSVLLLVTVLGFLNSGRIDAEDFSVVNSLFRFIPCMMIFGSYYLSKAFDLQRAECGQYLEVGTEDHQHVHPTYACDDAVAGRTWENLNYWKISVDIFPALGSIIIYTLLQFRTQSTGSLEVNPQLHLLPPALPHSEKSKRDSEIP